MSQEFDIIVFGASGFTGRLVAEYLAATYPTGVRWAMGGRSLEKLAQVRDEIGAPGDTPLMVCDSDDAASLKAMVTATNQSRSHHSWTLSAIRQWSGCGLRRAWHGLCRFVRRACVDAQNDRRA